MLCFCSIGECIISNLCQILFKLIYKQHEQLNKFMLLCLSLNINEEIDSFIDRKITSSAAMLDEENTPLSWLSSKNVIDSSKAMSDFFNCCVSAAEQYTRNFYRRQDSFNISKGSDSKIWLFIK